jgi:hypothetical protein
MQSEFAWVWLPALAVAAAAMVVRVRQHTR